jgi:hypothetical protein
MSSGLSGPGGSPSLGGPLAGGLFGGGMTGFGFSIPQGDPGSIESAARAAQSLAQSIRDQGAALRGAASIALETDGGWGGQAASAYAGYSSHVIGVIDSDAGGCEAAAEALSALSRALAEAQAVTKQALADCERYHEEMVAQQQAAAQAAAAKATAVAQAAAATHPMAQVALSRQAEAAGHTQSTAEAAANTAETEFKAAQSKGQHADQTYQETVRATAGRLESAAGDMRLAPQVAGGPAVPITVTQSDAALASSMLGGAGGLAAAAAAISNPGQLNSLACDNQITPGVALEYLQGVRNKEELAKIAAEDKGADGSLTGAIPGLSAVIKSPVGQFVTGAWDTTKGAVEFAIHPGEWMTAANSLLSTNPAYRQLAYGENPLTAQQNASSTSTAILKGTVDYKDWASGNYAKALGSLAPLDLKGVAELRNLWKAVPEARPEITNAAGTVAGNVFKVPYADDASKAVAPLTRYTPGEVGTMLRVQPVLAKNSLLSVAATGIIWRGRVDSSVLQGMSKLPADPQIIVVSKPTANFVYHTGSGLKYRITLAGQGHGG